MRMVLLSTGHTGEDGSVIYMELELLVKMVLLSTGPTGEDGPAFALLLHASLLLPRHGEGHLEHEASDVVALLEVGLPVHQLLVLQVGCDVCHLDVGVLRVQVFGVDLWQINRANQKVETFILHDNVIRDGFCSVVELLRLQEQISPCTLFLD